MVHPLQQLSIAECNIARDVILGQRSGKHVVDFRTIALEEPAKALLQPYLEAECEGTLKSTDTLPRLARVAYDVASENKTFEFYESVVDLGTRRITVNELIDSAHHAPLTL